MAKSYKSKIIYPIILIIILGGMIVLLINYFLPYYIIKPRGDDVKNFKGVNEEKAIGWLRVQGTNIDFPIVYYYDTDVTDPTNDLGWSYSDDKKLVKKVTLFSHNVLNVSSNPLIADKNHKRFEQLMSFIYPSFLKENKYIQYTVGGKDYLYKIYAVSFQEEAKIDYSNVNMTNEEAKKYIDDAKKKSYFEFDTDVVEKDDLISLVTCTRFFGATTDYSFVVDARRVRREEKVKNYGITEKKSYNRIKEIMKGDLDNEEM